MAALAESVAGAGGHQRLEPVAGQVDAVREVAQVAEGPAPGALGDERLGVLAAEAHGLAQPEAHAAVRGLDLRLDGGAVDVDRVQRHAAALGVAQE